MVRIDTPGEADYYRNGGIMQYVLRSLLKDRRTVDRGNKRFLVLAALLLGAVIMKELRKSPEERTWHGKLGFVPYDLRPPTLERVRSTLLERGQSTRRRAARLRGRVEPSTPRRW